MKNPFARFLWLLLILQSVSAQTPKTDREETGLKGKVRSVISQVENLSKDNKGVERETPLVYTESYDEQGNRVERIDFDYRGNIREKSVYKTIDGDKTAMTEYVRHDYDPPPAMAVPSQGEQKPRDPRYTSKFKYKYDGNTVERSTYSNDGTFTQRIVTTYDKANKVKVEAYDRDGRLYFNSTSVYGDKGEEIVTIYYRGGVISSKFKYTDYEIDWRGNWIKRKMWLGKNEQAAFQPHEIQSRTITYFDDAASTAMNDRQPGTDRAMVIRVNTGALAERAIKKVNPVYPREAADAGIAGEVLVEVSVDEQGNVASVEGVTGDRMLVEAVVAAVRQWKFKPTKLSGKAVRVIGRLRFKFGR